MMGPHQEKSNYMDTAIIVFYFLSYFTKALYINTLIKEMSKISAILNRKKTPNDLLSVVTVQT